MKSLYIRTFGCQMNVHDSERIAGIWAGRGYAPADGPSGATVAIVNSCAVRRKPEEKVFSELGRWRALKAEGAMRFIGVAGCVAQKAGARILRRAPYVDFVVGPGAIPSFGEVIDLLERGERGIVMIGRDQPAPGSGGAVIRQAGVRAWVTVMEGCDNFCSYCVVPHVRGRETSRPPEGVLQEVAEAVADGHREVVLLGQNVNSYGRTLSSGASFPSLLRAVARVPGLLRVRFVTSHPRDLTGELVEVMATEPVVCPQIHLPLQSGSDRVLAAMNRGYTLEEYRRKIGLLRERVAGIAISTDFIVGFPGETEEEFARTLGAAREIGFDAGFSFAYSPREGTSAFALPDDVPLDVKQERLLAIQEALRSSSEAAVRALIGTPRRVLVEGPSPRRPEWLTGRDETNRIVHFAGEGIRHGDVPPVVVTKILPNCLLGVLADS